MLKHLFLFSAFICEVSANQANVGSDGNTPEGSNAQPQQAMQTQAIQMHAMQFAKCVKSLASAQKISDDTPTDEMVRKLGRCLAGLSAQQEEIKNIIAKICVLPSTSKETGGVDEHKMQACSSGVLQGILGDNNCGLNQKDPNYLSGIDVDTANDEEFFTVMCSMAHHYKLEVNKIGKSIKK